MDGLKKFSARRHRDVWQASLAVLLLLGVSAGCSDFDPYNRLNSLRVLAVQSEPVSPLPGETTTLTPLIYALPTDPVVSVQWSWCPLTGAANEGYPCLFANEAQLTAFAATQGMDVGAVPPFDLGTMGTASFAHTLNPAVLAGLCAAIGAPGVPGLPRCQDGFPIKVRLVVRTATEELVTVRDLMLRTESAAPVNTNPVIGNMFAKPSEVEAPLDDAGTVTLFRRRNNDLRVEVATENAQAYTGLDERKKPLATTERLFLSWFVETGETKFERTSFVAGEIGLDKLAANKWKPEGTSDYPGTASTLWLILRDNREGVSWKRARVTLAEPVQ